MYQHAIDNFKLCWESSKKKLVKKHRSASKPLHNCNDHCNVSFFNNDHAYMYLYFCMKWWLQLFCSQLQILPAPTAPLIVDKSNVAKGLASRFLWIFLKPVFKPFLAIEVPTNKYEGLSPPTSCFKFCYEEPVCYHFPSNSFLIHKNTTEIGPKEYNLGTQNWYWVNKREFRTSQQSETEIHYS